MGKIRGCQEETKNPRGGKEEEKKSVRESARKFGGDEEEKINSRGLDKLAGRQEVKQ